MNITDNHSNSFFSKHREIWLCLLLVTATFAVYWQVHSYGFIELDDNLYVSENRYVKNGFTTEGLIWSFTNTDVGMWIPLVWISYMADTQLHGASPGWHHLTNVCLHLLNILLLFFLLKKITGGFWESGFVAALFALHPLHVESVVWITERKDVLSTFFFLLTIRMYVRYIQRPQISRYLLTALFFTLGLMAKPMLVTMPFVMMLLDYWPLKRFGRKPSVSYDDSKKQGCPVYLVLEKIPFFMLGAIIGMITFAAHQRIGAVSSIDALTIDVRIANALFAYVMYMGKMILPTKLAVLYPHPGLLPWWQVAGSFLLLAGISWFTIKSMRSRPYLAVGWIWYLVTLLPVIGLFQAGTQQFADRFVYVPLIGLYFGAVWYVSELSVRLPHRKLFLAALTIVLFPTLMAVTWKQVRYWENSIVLFQRTFEVTPPSSLLHYNMGVALDKLGRTEEAVEHYLKAVQINPDNHKAYNNLGLALDKLGRTEEAVEHYLKALRIEPENVKRYVNLGNTLAKQGLLNQAARLYVEALRLKPDFADAHNNLGIVFFLKGDIKAAAACFREALRIKPDYVNARNNLKKLLMTQQKNQ